MAYKNGSAEFFEIKIFGLNKIFKFLTAWLLFFNVDDQAFISLKKILLTILSLILPIGLVSDPPQMNWFVFLLIYTLANFVGQLIAFFVPGLFLVLYTFKTNIL